MQDIAEGENLHENMKSTNFQPRIAAGQDIWTVPKMPSTKNDQMMCICLHKTLGE